MAWRPAVPVVCPHACPGEMEVDALISHSMPTGRHPCSRGLMSFLEYHLSSSCRSLHVTGAVILAEWRPTVPIVGTHTSHMRGDIGAPRGTTPLVKLLKSHIWRHNCGTAGIYVKLINPLPHRYHSVGILCEIKASTSFSPGRVWARSGHHGVPLC